MTKSKQRKHWYFIYYRGCVLCSCSNTTRERRYGKRPKEYWKRHDDEEYACSSHFQ